MGAYRDEEGEEIVRDANVTASMRVPLRAYNRREGQTKCSADGENTCTIMSTSFLAVPGGKHEY